MRNPISRQKFKSYIDLIRPFTLLTPVIVSISIMIASYFYNEINVDLLESFFIKIIPACFSLLILNGASNALNQAADIKTDKISKPYRPLIRGDLSVFEAKIISIILYIISLFVSMTISIVFFLFVLLITFFTVTYSFPPRMKNILFLNQLWVAIPRGTLGIFASWCVFGNVIEPIPITIGIIVFFFLIGGSITKDILDSDADRLTGTNTLVNTFGPKKAAFIVLPFLFFPFFIILPLIDIGILESYYCLLIFFAIPSYFIFYLMIREDSKSKFLENTSSWILMYFTYLSFSISFSFMTIFVSLQF